VTTIESSTQSHAGTMVTVRVMGTPTLEVAVGVAVGVDVGVRVSCSGPPVVMVRYSDHALAWPAAFTARTAYQ